MPDLSCSVSAILVDTAEGDMVRFVSSLLSHLHQYVDVYVDVYVHENVKKYVYVNVYVYVRVCARVHTYDLPQWFHVFLLHLTFIYML